ncbi:MAG: N,N-dimethylformamidase [Rhodospirillaceae bacterium]|nr:MAG: N,N-dimethylformamidase [Rhodospirillaceae bacterium]
MGDLQAPLAGIDRGDPDMRTGLPRKRIAGYASRMSVRPGDRIDFMVSCEDVSDYAAEIVRLISGDHHPDGMGFVEEPVQTDIAAKHKGRFQQLYAGSFAVIDDIEAFRPVTDFTLQAMIWPTAPGKGRQTLMGRRLSANKTGFALVLDEAGALAVEIGDGKAIRTISTDTPLREREWAFVAATFNASNGTLKLYQEPVDSFNRSLAPNRREARVDGMKPATGRMPFMIAAAGASFGNGRLVADCHFNGKIDSPIAVAAELDRQAMESLRRPDCPLPTAILAAWDFAQAIPTDRIIDRSPFARHGRLINLPARAMKGHNWTGEILDWKQAPEQYGAIHFHDDDLYDAGWDVDVSLIVPGSLRSGVYAAKLTAGDEVEYIPFVVRPGRDQKKAGAVFLMPTASYMAYANERTGLEGGARIHAFTNHLVGLGPGDIWLNEHPEVGNSLYCHHSDGSGVCYSSRLRPILNFRPGITSAWIGAAGTAPWQFNADLALIGWLEARGIPYDVITDEDLHEEGFPLLDGYNAVLTGSHPEYYSKAMYEALVSYLGRGGRLMYLGGNGFYWRIAYHPILPGVIELRRAEDGIRDWVAEGGEYFHSFTGEYGGMWSRMGRPIHALVGVGMAAQGFDVSSYYRRMPGSRDPRASFIFDGVEDEVIGDFGTVGGGAAGLELDRYDRSQGSPAHALVLASSESHSDTYFPPPDEINNATAMMDGRQNANIRADLVFFETQGGGAVFSTGSISWIGSLSHNKCDNNVSRITENVLRRFLESERFVVP